MSKNFRDDEYSPPFPPPKQRPCFSEAARIACRDILQRLEVILCRMKRRTSLLSSPMSNHGRVQLKGPASPSVGPTLQDTETFVRKSTSRNIS